MGRRRRRTTTRRRRRRTISGAPIHDYDDDDNPLAGLSVAYQERAR
jgi:hypothetical protein